LNFSVLKKRVAFSEGEVWGSGGARQAVSGAEGPLKPCLPRWSRPIWSLLAMAMKIIKSPFWLINFSRDIRGEKRKFENIVLVKK